MTGPLTQTDQNYLETHDTHVIKTNYNPNKK